MTAIEDYIQYYESDIHILKCLIKKSDSKLVQIDKKNILDWQGLWWYYDNPCFLVSMTKTNRGYHICCQGRDDFLMITTGIKANKAKDIYAQIIDGISIKTLEDLGLGIG